VGVEIVRELYGVMSARGAVGGYVVSSGAFSDEAADFAAGRNIELWDGAKLKAVIREVQDRSFSSPFPAHNPPDPIRRTPTITEAAAPACPTCGSAMVKRVAKRGAKSGQPFWGCLRYPNCRGTRSISIAPP
jgi:restriction system protein